MSSFLSPLRIEDTSLGKHGRQVFVLVIITVALSAVAAICRAVEPSPQLTLPCRIVSVYDGDTATADLTIRVNIRLLDCWAPEVTGDEKTDGLRAKRKLEELILGKECTLQIPLHGDLGKSFTFSRVLGRLFVGGQDVSEQMVAAGVATATKKE